MHTSFRLQRKSILLNDFFAEVSGSYRSGFTIDGYGPYPDCPTTSPDGTLRQSYYQIFMLGSKNNARQDRIIIVGCCAEVVCPAAGVYAYKSETTFRAVWDMQIINTAHIGTKRAT